MGSMNVLFNRLPKEENYCHHICKFKKSKNDLRIFSYRKRQNHLFTDGIKTSNNVCYRGCPIHSVKFINFRVFFSDLRSHH